MICTHDAAERDTASEWDGLCPLCLSAENGRMRSALLEIATDPCLDPEGNKQIAKRGLGLDPLADIGDEQLTNGEDDISR